MSELTLYHRLYTHVPSLPGDLGGRAYNLGEIDAEMMLGAQELTTLDKLLSSMIPPPDGRAWAAGRLSDASFVVTCQSAPDDQGRRGALTHARLARVPVGMAMLDVPALAEIAKKAYRADVVIDAARIGGFVNRLREEELGVSAPDWSPLKHDRGQVSAVMEVLLASIAREETITASVAPTPNTDDLFRLLANIWSLLPLVFQESVSWSLNAQQGVRVKVAFTTAPVASPEIPQPVKELARRYVDWVLDRPDQARRFIESARGPGLYEFEIELKEAMSAAVEPRGEPVMPSHKNRNKEPRPEPQQRGTLDPQLVEYLNEQIRESEDSILNWLSGVLNTRPDAARVEPPRLHGGTPRAHDMPPNAVMAAGAIALVALIGLGWMWFKASRAENRIATLEKQIVALAQATGVPPPVTTTTNPVDEGVTDLLKTPEALTGAGWPERFQWAIENRQTEVQPMITRIARNAPPDRLSDEKRNDIQRIADLLKDNQILSSADRRSLRAYLFELIASERHPAGGKKLAVDAAPADVPASAIAKVKEDLQIATASNDPGGAELQSEVVLRWIAQQR